MERQVGLFYKLKQRVENIDSVPYRVQRLLFTISIVCHFFYDELGRIPKKRLIINLH